MSYVHRTDINGKRYVPVVAVSFYTATQCYQARGEYIGLKGVPDPTNQVLSINTTKTLESPAGAFSINLAGLEWEDKLDSNDMVVIQMGYKTENGKVDLKTVMIGLIDTIRGSESVGEENPRVMTTITGRDFGKIIIEAMLRFYPVLGVNKKAEEKLFLTQSGWIQLLKAFTNDNSVKGTPAHILDIIMRFILQRIVDVNWKVYDEKKSPPAPKNVGLAQVLRYQFAKANLNLPMILNAYQYEGSIWNLMERACSKPFFELFVDTREETENVIIGTIEESSSIGKSKVVKEKGGYAYPPMLFGSDNSVARVYFRVTPFDKPFWEQLKTHRVTSEDVIDRDLSRSGLEVYNLFWAGTTITPFNDFDLKAIAPPYISTTLVERYGLKPLEVNIEGFELARDQQSKQAVTLTELSKKWSRILKAWYEINHRYKSGNLSVRGKGDYKIGQRFIWEDRDLEFYIEGVSHTFNVFTNWTTNLTVTRGMKVGTTPDSGKLGSIAKPNAPVKKPVSKSTKTEIKARYHTVKKNETLWTIAPKYDVTVDALWEANKSMLIARDKRNAKDHGRWIYPNQKLLIP